MYFVHRQCDKYIIMSSEKKCCVPGCSGNLDSRNTLHLFPNPSKEVDRFKLWLFNIGGDIKAFSNEYIYKNRRVCHAHFESKFCCRNDRISNIAVPTLNLPVIQQGNNVQLELSTKRADCEVDTDIAQSPLCDDSTLDKLFEDPITAESICTAPRSDNDIIEENKKIDVPLGTDGVESTRFIDDDGELNLESSRLFSWQQKTVITDRLVPDNDEVVCLNGDDKYEDLTIDLELDDGEHDVKPEADETYTCNLCEDVIIGGRTTCAQCEDYDLCARCAGGTNEHAHHYLLRVPPRRPPEEVQYVLHKLRELLTSLSEPVLLTDAHSDVKLHVEAEEPSELLDPLYVDTGGVECEDTSGAECADTCGAECEERDVTDKRGIMPVQETRKRNYDQVHERPPAKRTCGDVTGETGNVATKGTFNDTIELTSNDATEWESLNDESECTVDDIAEWIRYNPTEESIAPSGDALRGMTSSVSGDALRGMSSLASGDALRGMTSSASGDALRGVTSSTSGEALRGVTSSASGVALRGVTSSASGAALGGVTSSASGYALRGVTSSASGAALRGVTSSARGDALRGVTSSASGDALRDVTSSARGAEQPATYILETSTRDNTGLMALKRLKIVIPRLPTNS